MFDEIININDFGGEFEKGTVVANLKINPELWFFKCHFKEDPVMPGCLGLDAMWQLLGFYLLWSGLPGIGRALGAENIKFFGQVLPSADTVRYELDIKRVINYKTTHNKIFDQNFVVGLKSMMPDMVYIYSQNSALSFLNYIKIYDTENLWMNTNLMCISEKTSAILNEIKWKKIFLFNPGEEEFLLYKI